MNSLSVQSINEMRKKIFPIYIDDVYLSYPTDLFILLKFKSVNIDTSTISKKTIEYLIKYKKFMDSDIVYSMANEPEISFMHVAIRDIVQSNVPGDIVEAGVWRGGMAIWMNYLLHQYHSEKTNIWLFDSFDEFPEPTYEADKYVHPVTKILYETPVSSDDVTRNFEKFNLLTPNLLVVKGKYENSVPNVDISKISILHLDCDYYDPTLLMLDKYYTKISQGGYIIINNYFYDYIHTRIAVDEYRTKNNITTPIQKIGERYGYWKV
jgi:O-methyltransferase